MDLRSAGALLLACKSNAVQQLMLTCYKEEAKAFARTHSNHCDFPDEADYPATQCQVHRASPRCRRAVTELSITQYCAYHQDPRCGDLRVQRMREMAVRNPWRFELLIQ